MNYIFSSKNVLNMKGVILFSLLFVLSFSAMAESPPGLSQELQKFEMKSILSAPAFVAPSLEAIEAESQFFDLSGQPCETPQTIFATCNVAPQNEPALQHGNNYRWCQPCNYFKNKTTCATAKNLSQSKADFKVGWQSSHLS